VYVLVLCHIIQTDPDSPRTEQPTPEGSAGESKATIPPMIKKREIQKRYRDKMSKLKKETADERDFFRDKAQNLQDQNQALENASILQQQKIAYLESHLQDAHWKMAALESRLKESEETASLESQLQLARETIAAFQSRLKEREETAASNLQQQKTEFSGSRRQSAHNTIAAIRESEMANQAINTSNTDRVSQPAGGVQFSNSCREQEITLLQLQLLEKLKDAVRTRE
jgi:hypothetical protein